MEPNMPMFPFEVSMEEILRDPESYVDAVFSCLESEFLVMPKGPGFVEYSVFERGYEALKAATGEFSKLNPEKEEAYWLDQPGAPKAKLENEKPQGETIDYDKLIAAWREGRVK